MTDLHSGVSYRQLGLLFLVLLLGVVGGLLFGNLESARTETFSTATLIGFVLSVLVSGASIVLAIAAISLGRTSEQAMIRRSDESIRLQNDVFLKTTDALERIESSTGVTEKRIEDIISGRVGDISHRIAEIAAEQGGRPIRDMSEVEDEIRESILETVRREMGPAGRFARFDEEREKREKRQEIKAQAQKEYSATLKRLLNAFANRSDSTVIRHSEGKLSADGYELFDGVFEINDEKIGVSAFSKHHSEFSIDVFVLKAAEEIVSERITRALMVFFADQEPIPAFDVAKSAVANLQQEIQSKVFVLAFPVDEIEEKVSGLNLLGT